MLLAGAVLLAAALVQPAGGGGVAGSVRKGGTLRLGLPGDPDSVDPALAYHPQAWTLEFATCAKLFNFPDAGGAEGARVIPEVATGLPRVSRDGKTYTFELKQAFRFHTGAPVTARSFAAAFNRDANPKMHSPAVPYLREIVGAAAVIDGKATTISGVRVLAPYRLRIRLTKPLGDFTARLTMPFFCPLPANTPVDPAGVNDPPGSGPYYIAERVINRQMVLKRNPYYRGPRPANVDRIVLTIGPDCALATEQDRMDVCLSNPWTDDTIRRFAAQYGINRPGGQFFITPTLATWFFVFNHDRPAFKGPGQIPLKKAINYAIDRPALARPLGYLRSRRTDQLLPPALGREASIYPITGADPATARKWLAKAKLKPRTLVLYTWAGSFGATVAQDFAFELRQIGIDVEVKTYEGENLQERAGTRGEPYDVALEGWASDYPDGAGFFVPLLDGSTLRQTKNHNLAYFNDAKTTARIAAANTLTGDARRRAWADLDIDLMRNNPPWAPFIHSNLVTFISKSYGCYLSHPIYTTDIAAACKK
jgi:ABC-type transport system substrate-binding protein